MYIFNIHVYPVVLILSCEQPKLINITTPSAEGRRIYWRGIKHRLLKDDVFKQGDTGGSKASVLPLPQTTDFSSMKYWSSFTVLRSPPRVMRHSTCALPRRYTWTPV